MNNKDWVCPICLGSNEEDCHILEPCKHKFHTKCLIESLRKCNSKCPYCRGLDPSMEKKEDINFGEINFDNTILPPGSIRVNRYNTGWVEYNLVTDSDMAEEDNISISDDIFDDNLSIGDIDILEEIINDEILDIDHSLDISNSNNTITVDKN